MIEEVVEDKPLKKEKEPQKQVSKPKKEEKPVEKKETQKKAKEEVKKATEEPVKEKEPQKAVAKKEDLTEKKTVSKEKIKKPESKKFEQTKGMITQVKTDSAISAKEKSEHLIQKIEKEDKVIDLADETVTQKEVIAFDQARDEIELTPEQIKTKTIKETKPVINVETLEKKKEATPEKKGFFSKLGFGKKEEKPVEPKKTEGVITEQPPKEEVVEPKGGFFSKLKEAVSTTTLSEDKFEELFEEFELALLENNVALEVVDKIKNDLKRDLTTQRIQRGKLESIVDDSLKKSIEELFDVEGINLIKQIKNKKPYVICFFGVNGAGKTTNLAKLANLLKEQGLTVVMAACDTFRAAAIQQIEEHAKKLNIKLIKHDYGADPAAVAYDAIEHAKAKGVDVVLIDTAGRSHANENLMQELSKLVRVAKPDLKVFVGDSLTGNDAVEQAMTYDEKIGIDGIILSKMDVDEKGGAAISISYVTKKPILYIGTGQTYDDFEEFDKQKIIEQIGI